MSWLIKFAGVEVDSDDFTIGELGEIEKASGVPWSIANPLREIKVAKAFLAVALLRSGTPEKDVVNELEKLTLRKMKSAFVWRADEVEEGEEGPDPSDPSPSPTSLGSSPGDRGRAGSPAT